MLENIEIVNFRCLKRVKVPLRPLTVLIGSNDSGKSAFLKAIALLAYGDEIGNVKDFWRRDSKNEPVVTSITRNGPIKVSRVGVERALPADAMRCSYFQLPSEGVSMTSEGYNDSSGPPSIGTKGEEPENGIHPKRLRDVMQLLRELTEGKHGNNASQVILTTHSPYLLDLDNPDTDQVLVFRRNDDGSRTAEPVAKERLDVFLDEFKLGEIWYNQGESQLVSNDLCSTSKIPRGV
jgi:hypothetical protein